MDPRVVAHYSGDVSLANISPRKKSKILSPYAAPATPTPGSTSDAAVAHTVAAPRPGQVARCTGCGYVFSSVRGDAHEGFPPGTPWSAVPDSWICPDCGVRDKADFEVVGTVEA
jgi:alkane 1-monooxygenase